VEKEESMDCHKAERLLLRSFDGPVEEGAQAELRDHLAACPDCRAKAGHYGLIRDVFKGGAVPQPLPYFRERVMAKLAERERLSPVRLWLRWAHGAAAFSLAAFVLFGAGVLLFQPKEPQELSQVESLLLRNENPLKETASVLDQKRTEDKNMMLIFASLEDQSRR
jgi:anti-sigma factor RsiW